MCQDRNSISARLHIAADLSHTGKAYWRDMPIDRCIAPIVVALQAGGIDMLSSCCGHGKEAGHIWLEDGRVLIVTELVPQTDVGKEWLERVLSAAVLERLEGKEK